MKHRLKSSVFNDDILSTLYKEREKSKPKVCFMSGKERDGTGHSRFECEYKSEVSKIAPSSYNIDEYTSAFSQILGKVASNAGYGGLASRTPRFVYPPREIRLPLKGRKESKISKHTGSLKKEVKTAKPPPPFGSAIPRKTGVLEKKDDTPGFNYDISRAYRKREMDFDHSFGGRTKLRPHVLWKCTPENTDTCGKCQKKPCGDYYISGSNVLCLRCFDSEWNKPSKFSRRQLYSFKTIRDCSDIHEHGGTSAAIPLVSNRDIRRQRVLESYFASFASPRKVIRKLNKVAPKCQFAKNNENKLTVLFEGKFKEGVLKSSK